MPKPNLLILLAALLPPIALEMLGSFVEEHTLATPYGEVGPVALRASTDFAVWVQPYTGLPSRTDPRATIFAARLLGVQKLLVWDMGVGINPMLRRGQPIITTDYIEWMSQQPNTFFDAQADTGDPVNDPDWLARQPTFCPQLTTALHTVIPFAPSAVYLGVDGPRRETPAEARMFRSWGVDVTGQNLVPEVALARELGLCFAGLVTVTAYASDQAVQSLEGEVRAGLEFTARTLPEFVRQVSSMTTCSCQE